MRVFAKILIALALTIPIAVLLNKTTNLNDFLFSPTGYKLLNPLFDILGVVGVEGHIEVVAWVILLISLGISFAITSWLAIVLSRYRRR